MEESAADLLFENRYASEELEEEREEEEEDDGEGKEERRREGSEEGELTRTILGYVSE